MSNKKLMIAGKEFKSRLFVGTGKFASGELLKMAIEASGSEMVTMALRRVDINNPEDNILNNIDPKKYQLLPNTAGAQNAEEAVRLAHFAKASGLTNWIKLEVTPDPKYLLPDGEETLKAAKILIKEGFVVLPYIQADPILAKRLEEAGVATVMPLASPIGSNKGIRNLEMIRIIIEQSSIPVVVDAGLGKPSDAAQAMELGADAVLVNTAIAAAQDPVKIAKAFKLGVAAGQMAYEAGIANEYSFAQASSPVEWVSKLEE